MSPNRKPRPQSTCHCGAYPFPHRLAAGKCTGLAFVEQYVGGPVCLACTHYSTSDEQSRCGVLEPDLASQAIEPLLCPALSLTLNRLRNRTKESA